MACAWRWDCISPPPAQAPSPPARSHSKSLQPEAVLQARVVEALNLNCRPNYIAPDPYGSLCSWWAHRRLDPCCFVGLGPSRPMYEKWRHSILFYSILFNSICVFCHWTKSARMRWLPIMFDCHSRALWCCVWRHSMLGSNKQHVPDLWVFTSSFNHILSNLYVVSELILPWNTHKYFSETCITTQVAVDISYICLFFFQWLKQCAPRSATVDALVETQTSVVMLSVLAGALDPWIQIAM